MTDYLDNFDAIEHGLEEGLDYLNRLVNGELGVMTGTYDDPLDADAESARDNLATALTKYREQEASDD